MPQTDAERALRLHVKPVGALKLAEVRKGMSERTRARFDQTFNVIADFKATREATFAPLPAADGELLVACNVAEPATDLSTVGLAHAFTVVEEKSDGPRRRFILDPHDLNDWLEEVAGYEAQVPLPHITAHLPYAHDEWAICEDFSTGFHQVELPLRLRHLFRFRCGDRVLQMTRLPMGLRTAPELFHTLAATLAGDRLFCVPAWRSPLGVHVDTWIDNVRFSGKRQKVDLADAEFQSRCTAVSATLNAGDRSAGRDYVFCGVKYADGTVAVAAKTHGRVAAVADKVARDALTIRELEILFGRLWFASAILGVEARNYWFAIKMARRRLADVNGGRRKLDGPAELMAAASAELSAWVAKIAANAPRAPPPPPTSPEEPKRSFTLFTDATLVGWGAVLIDDATQQPRIAGGRWRDPPSSIGPAETRAVALGLEAFARHLAGNHAHLRVDNTSAIAAINRRIATSGAVNAELNNVFARLNGVTYDVSYVKSADNLADGPSRGDMQLPLAAASTAATTTNS